MAPQAGRAAELVVEEVEALELPRRPLGLTLFSAFDILGGLFGTCAAALGLIGAVKPRFNPGGVLGFIETAANALGFVGGAVLLVAGIGMFALRPWARKLALGYCLYQIGMGLAWNGLTLVAVFLAPPAAAGGAAATSIVLVGATVVSLIFSVGYALLQFVYLMRPAVHGVFAGLTPDDVAAASSDASGWLRTTPGWVTSMVVHASILLMLGLLTIQEQVKELAPDLTALRTESLAEVEELAPEEELAPVDVNVEQQVESVDASSDVVGTESVDVTEMLDEGAAAPNIEATADIGPIEVATSDLVSSAVGTTNKNSLGGRAGAAKMALVAQGGGNQQSEDAVARGLKWLAEHQNPDGSWSFEHNKGRCQGRCKSNGKIANGQNGATAIALLPFLGAGATHREGRYKKVVQTGLAYLINNMKVDANGGSLIDGGSMYSHGLGSICICEAYAMTEDRNLFNAAQQAVNFIVYAQDPVGGGWRYGPRQPGDTSVVGWQLMALRSAHMGYLEVPQSVIAGAANFLNTTQTDGGAAYGYTGPENRPSTTAIGLLCRMYMGWKKDEPALVRGVERLSQMGPAKDDVYYNYYATQVMHHMGGEKWTKWNTVMRDHLVNTQSREGHEDGSWYFKDGPHNDAGGRLYVTAMCIMTLEVYYRYLPLYREEASEVEAAEESPKPAAAAGGE
ncbi:MAG: terpene cyclase/mutase family protein [Pirellulales bacterium]|nr:terpene cyclase/mutase family protein [Pirellulales bacterium]